MNVSRPPLPKQVRATVTVAASARAAQFVETLLVLLIAVEADAGTGVAAAALLAHHSGVVLGTLAGGALVDRVGARTTVAAGLAVSGVAVGVLAMSEAHALLVVAALVYGIGAAAWRLAIESSAARGLAVGAPHAEEGDSATLRARSFGTLAAVRNAGALVSAVAVAAGIDVRDALLVQALTTGAAAVAAATLLPPGLPPERSPHPQRTERALWLLALATAPGILVVFQAFAALPIVYDGGTYRAIVLVNAVVVLLIGPLVWSLSTRLGGGRVLAAATMVLGVSMGLAPVLEEIAVVPTIAWSATELAVFSITPALVTGLAPAAATGRYQARFATAQGVVAAVAVAVGPLLVEASTTAFAVTSIALGAIGAAAITLLSPMINLSLSQPVGCPCGALLCACAADHHECANPSPLFIHAAEAAESVSLTVRDAAPGGASGSPKHHAER